MKKPMKVNILRCQTLRMKPDSERKKAGKTSMILDRTCIRLEQPPQYSQERRLPAAIGSKNPHPFSRRNRERNIIQSMHTPFFTALPRPQHIILKKVRRHDGVLEVFMNAGTGKDMSIHTDR